MMPHITSPTVTELLDALYADAAASDHLARQEAEAAGAFRADEKTFYRSMRKAYMAIGRDFGHLLYSLARTARATSVVEFGTSFGVSTIYLASAMRDNGGGRVITTEFDPGKAEQALKNLTAAGVADYVEIRVGDALETLATPPAHIDLIFLDGAKALYLDVLKRLEPALRPGGIVASDNTDHDGMEAFLDHLRHPANGYASSAISTGAPHGRAHEISVRG